MAEITDTAVNAVNIHVQGVHSRKDSGATMNRKDARILAMQYIFQLEAQKDLKTSALDTFLTLR